MTSFNMLAISCVDRCLFLAGEAQYIQMGRRFRRHGGGLDWTELLLPTAVIACAVGIAWLASRYFKLRSKRNADSLQALFGELCRAHSLDRASQQLLCALASAHRLASPAQLFVEPQRFDTKRLGRAFDSRNAQITALHSSLFADSAHKASEVL